MKKLDLEKHIQQQNLGELGNKLIRSIKRAIRLVPTEAVTVENGSKFGGLPYAPKNFVWPQSSDPANPQKLRYEPHQYVKGPLRFICQIKIHELPFLPWDTSFGEYDLLLFFASTHKADFPLTDCASEDWLLLLSNSSDGMPCEPPQYTCDFADALDDYSDAPIENESILLPEKSMFFEEHWQINPALYYGLPNIASRVDFRLTDIPMHLLGGYSNYLQTPIENVASEYCKVLVETITPIAQFDTDPSINLKWHGGGRAFFVEAVHDSTSDQKRVVLITQQ